MKDLIEKMMAHGVSFYYQTYIGAVDGGVGTIASAELTDIHAYQPHITYTPANQTGDWVQLGLAKLRGVRINWMANDGIPHSMADSDWDFNKAFTYTIGTPNTGEANESNLESVVDVSPMPIANYMQTMADDIARLQAQQAAITLLQDAGFFIIPPR